MSISTTEASKTVRHRGLPPRKKIVQALGTPLVALGLQLVAKAEFLRSFSGAFVVAQKDNFDIGVQCLPRLERISLDDAKVPAKGFCGGEKKLAHAYLRTPFRM
jgi:hypothetical protein